MARPRPGRGTTRGQVEYDLPSSHGLLRLVVDALDLRRHAKGDEKVKDKTLQRVLQGNTDQVSQESLRRVYVLVMKAFFTVDIFPGTRTPECEETLVGANEQGTEFLAFMVRWYAVKWDRALAETGGRLDETRVIRFLRTMILDLAFRAAGYSLLSEEDEFLDLEPRWNKEPRERGYLRSLLKQVKERNGARSLTRASLADGVGVDISTVDRWCSEKVRPSDENLQEIAVVICDVLGESAFYKKEVLAGLRWHFGLAAVADLLAKRLGREVVVDLVQAWLRLTRATVEHFKQTVAPVWHQNFLGPMLLMSGRLFIEDFEGDLNKIAAREKHLHWRSAIEDIAKERTHQRGMIRALAQAPYLLASIAWALGQVPLAILLFRMVELLVPTCEEVRLYQGMLLISTGRVEEAWRYLKGT